MVRESRVKKTEEKTDKVYIHVLYSQQSEGGEPESDEPYSNRSDEHTSTTFKGVVVSPDKDTSDLGLQGYDSWRQSFEAPREAFAEPRALVYAVVGYYQDGDTFGTSYGNMFIVDVYGNLDKANAVAAQLRYEDANEAAKKNPSIFGGSSRYVPWGGYFSRLERIEVEVLHVLQQRTNPADTKKGPPKNPDDIPSW